MCTIRVFSSSESAFLVNSFLIETPNGLVVVDTQFLTSSALALCAAIRATGKTPLALIVTHPHPDHFNGTAEIEKEWPGLPIYATQTTLDVIRATEADKRAAWTPMYGADYPQRTVLPDRIVASGETVTIDGEDIVIDDLGAGESADITVLHLPRSEQLVASDLLYNKVHPWLAEGRTALWLNQIELVRSRYRNASEVYAGHGLAGTLDSLVGQADYLRDFRARVGAGVADLRQPTASEKASIVEQVRNAYPGYPLEMLVPMNVDGVARELSSA